MKQKDLEEYRKLVNEIKMLENKIKRLSRKEYKFGIDSVSTAATFPYSKHNITISGYGYDSSHDDEKDKMIKEYKEQLNNRRAEFEQVQSFIKSIDDSAVRQIIECRYIEGLSWTATAKKVYNKPAESVPRMIIKRFLEKI